MHRAEATFLKDLSSFGQDLDSTPYEAVPPHAPHLDYLELIGAHRNRAWPSSHIVLKKCGDPSRDEQKKYAQSEPTCTKDYQVFLVENILLNTW